MSLNNMGALVGAGVSTLFPGPKSTAITIGAAVAGDVAFRVCSRLPRVDTIVQCFVSKPNAVFVDNNGPIFSKLETYIVNRYIEQVRACQLEPRNGEVTYSLREIQFHKPLYDTFEGESLQLQLMQSNGSYEVSAESFRSMFYRFACIGTEPSALLGRSNQDATGSSSSGGGRIVIVSSWKLSVPQLKRYIASICEFRKNAQITTMYTSKVVGYDEGSGASRRQGGGYRNAAASADRNAVLSWEEIHVKSNKRLTNTILSKQVERELLDDVKRFMGSEEWYNNKGIPYKRGYILHGPPGTGKTSIIKAIAAEYHLPVFIVDFEIISTNAQFSKLMKEINHYTNNKPYILALEDLDRCRMLNRRSHFYGDDEPNGSISTRCLLNEIDGLIESHGRLLFITANNERKLEQIDQEALMRPGRVDRKIKIDYCDFDQVQRLLFHFFGLTHECIEQLDAKDLAGKYSPATVINLLQQSSVNGGDPNPVIRKLFRNQPRRTDAAAATNDGGDDGQLCDDDPLCDENGQLPSADGKLTPMERAQARLRKLNNELARSRRCLRSARSSLNATKRKYNNRQQEAEKQWAAWLKQMERQERSKHGCQLAVTRKKRDIETTKARIKTMKEREKKKKAAAAARAKKQAAVPREGARARKPAANRRVPGAVAIPVRLTVKRKRSIHPPVDQDSSGGDGAASNSNNVERDGRESSRSNSSDDEKEARLVDEDVWSPVRRVPPSPAKRRRHAVTGVTGVQKVAYSKMLELVPRLVRRNEHHE